MIVEVLGIPCQVVLHPVPPDIAHPDEGTDVPCTHCAIIQRPDTGELVLAWGYRTGDFGISRADAKCDYHRATWPTTPENT